MANYVSPHLKEGYIHLMYGIFSHIGVYPTSVAWIVHQCTNQELIRELTVSSWLTFNFSTDLQLVSTFNNCK